MKFFTKKYFSQGFSLVEILVVLGLFSSIATLSLGSLFNAQSVNRRLQETQAILDNINLSTQTITRDIRFGVDFYATSSIPYGNDSPSTKRRNCTYDAMPSIACGVLIFTSSEASSTLDRVMYYAKNGVLYKTTYPYGEASSTEQMTSSDVVINSLIFYLEGAQTSSGTNDDNDAIDYKQPLITLLLSGTTRSASGVVASTTFSFQTNISPRELDNQ